MKDEGIIRRSRNGGRWSPYEDKYNDRGDAFWWKWEIYSTITKEVWRNGNDYEASKPKPKPKVVPKETIKKPTKKPIENTNKD